MVLEPAVAELRLVVVVQVWVQVLELELVQALEVVLPQVLVVPMGQHKHSTEEPR